MSSKIKNSIEGYERIILISMRIGSLLIVTVMLTMHSRSMRVFRWEQSVSGGLLVTYLLVEAGLALAAGTERPCGRVFQVYLCIVGALVFFLNAVVLWRRWRMTGPLTRVVVDLLVALGVQLRRQVLLKVGLSMLVVILMLIDLIVALVLVSDSKAGIKK